ncbi:MAG: UDP-galactopyranose mutase [Methanobacterium sp.]|nr:UDP-galactopyranose mutase [Methanobacterium sp.]
MFDYIIVGAGLAGSVLAERITNILGKKVLILEKRNHIGGNCYDYIDKNGIQVHKYGPHIFRTDLKHIYDYLSQFTDWNLYQHEVLGLIDGKKVPIPFNLNTLHELLPENLVEQLEKQLIEHFGFDVKVPILELKKTQDKDLKFLADFIYQKVFLNYTMKQWGFKPEDLDPSVTGRVPVYISKDNRYFQDKYQGIPKEGYTKLFEKMLDSPNIKIMLNTDYNEIMEINPCEISLFDKKYDGKIIFTGEIDEFFKYKYGKLPYRSLSFKFETIKKEYFQEVATVNYPNNNDFTRITEFKHFKPIKTNKTSIAKEYSHEYDKNVKGDIPYYPIPRDKNSEIYEKYKNEAQTVENVIFIGRLAEYRYYSMDNVIESALKVFKEKIINE